MITLRERTATLPSRPSIFLTLLPMLLLSSCEPGEDGSGAGSGSSDRDRKKRTKLPTDTMNTERIAAQDSLGKPPQPRNLLEGVEDECPVHHEKMKVREIPIVFGDAAPEKSEHENPSSAEKFPFGAEKIISTGNALLPGEPVTARVYQCASCVAARKAAEEKQALTRASH